MATILVVEDDKLSQRLLAKILGVEGHTALIADSVDAGWDILRRPTMPDLVILDNQLGRSWGWELLQKIRADPVFSPLPVIVYTGHTERSSILKYVELGVQGMLVKPYRADVIKTEVAKAVAADWISRLIEPPSAACERLKMKERDYYSMVAAAASTVEKDLQTIRTEVAERRGDARIQEPLTRIHEQSLALGMPVLTSSADALVRALQVRNSPEIQNWIQHLSTLQQLLRHRALGHMDADVMGGVIETPRPEKKIEAPPPRPIAPSKTPAGVFCRRMAAAPLWATGEYAARFGGGKLISADELAELYAQAPSLPVLAAFFREFEYLRVLPSAGIDEVCAEIAALPGFEKAYLEISKQLGSLDDESSELTSSVAIHRLGIYRSAVFLVCARIADSTQIASPLELQVLREHTMAVTVLSYEVAHSLRVSDEHLCAAAGLAHDLGKWFFAAVEPVLYGLALSVSLARERGVSEVEQDFFGTTHEQAGAAVLESGQAALLLRDAAAHHTSPDQVESARHRGMVATVALANQLAWCASAETEAQAAAVRAELLKVDHPIWTTLTSAGIELPMDIPELVDTLLRVAKNALWVTSRLTEWAAAVARSRR